jgi:exonuclease SbcC
MLKINKVELKNFCQHQERTLELKGGLTLITGKNGAGKSSLANAICGAFTGTFNHVNGTGGCIRQTIKSGEPAACYVEVQGELGNDQFIIHREIQSKSVKHHLYLNGKLAGIKASDIEDWIFKASGITPQLMAEFIFIPQQDMYSFLEATGTERNKKFSTLCGTKIYEEKRNELAILLTSDKARAETAAETSMEMLQENLEEAGENLKEINLRLKKASDNDDVKLVESYKKTLARRKDKLELINSWMRKFEKADELYNQYDAKYHEARATIKEVGQYRQSLDETRQSLKEICGNDTWGDMIGWLTEQIVAQDKKSQLRNELKTLQQRLADAESNAVEPPDPDALEQIEIELQQILTACVRLEQQKTTYKKLIETLQKAGRIQKDLCPLCQAPAESWGIDLYTIEESLGTVSTELQELNLQQKALWSKQAEWEKQQAEYNAHAANIETLQKQIKAKRHDYDAIPLENKKQFIETKDQLVELVETLKTEEERYKNAKDQLEKARETVSDLTVQINDFSTNEIPVAEKEISAKFVQYKTVKGEIEICFDETYEELKQLQKDFETGVKESETNLANLQDKLTAIAQLEGELNQATANYKNIEQKINAVIEGREKFTAEKEWYELCHSTLNWLKRDGIPRLIHTSVLRQLVTAINDELELFNTPFRVAVNDDLTFTAYFKDGTKIISKGLSGGQKVMLALAFWGAVNQTFAKNLGIMILDEPTDGLDSDNYAMLYELLVRWKQLLQQRQQQVIIISHDSDMQHVASQTINIEK